eukprot:scaffold16.g127.t1
MDPLDVLKKDLSYLERRVGGDLQAVADVHDELVAILNPLAATQMVSRLEEQIAGLQGELAVAHVQVHKSEAQLQESVANLSQLEASLQAAMPEALAAAAASAATAPAPPAPRPRSQREQRQRSARAGLESSLELPDALKPFWYPLEFSANLGADMLVPLELFGQAWVLFRDASGAAACVRDECAHRACPLSLGKVVDGEVECPYHGWRYDSAGSCTRMPSTSHCKGIGVQSLPVVEAEGLIWCWPGDPEAITSGPPVELVRPPPSFQTHSQLVLDVPVDHGLLIENLLDLAHAPFTHTTTFAKGWSVPDAVRFHAANLLDGRWDPYPIDMEFLPPCMVLSTIGLASPGKIEKGVRQQQCANHLHQLHVCLPAGRGRTRLLYSMSLDFMHWTRHVPGIQAFWRHIAGQVLGEDLVLVEGQQDSLSRGGDTWANPVPYDKLGVRYRRWRNSVASGDAAARARAEAGLRAFSAGELFSPEDSQDGGDAPGFSDASSDGEGWA